MTQKTMLTEFFTTNSRDANACNHYVWHEKKKEWTQRKSKDVIGRIYTAHPSEGERYYLRLLLTHIRGPHSFDELKTVDGNTFTTFKAAAAERGLLDDDEDARKCLEEAELTRMPFALRQLFATILAYCKPKNVNNLWNRFYPSMSEDYVHDGIPNGQLLQNFVLRHIDDVLQQQNMPVAQFDLPPFTEPPDLNRISKPMLEELFIPITEEDINSKNLLTDEQKRIFDYVMDKVKNQQPALIFIDGPAGSGKTFLYRAILANVLSQGLAAIATASSGISSLILPGGRTAHSRFKIPLSLISTSICSISKQSPLAELRKAAVLIWDEAPMTQRYAFEALDRTLRDITGVDLPFGGKIIILGGDFRQVLPVKPRASRAQTVDASISKSPLWRHVQISHLTRNMRVNQEENEFRNFVLRVGDGVENTVEGDMIRIPDDMVLPWENESASTSSQTTFTTKFNITTRTTKKAAPLFASGI